MGVYCRGVGRDFSRGLLTTSVAYGVGRLMVLQGRHGRPSTSDGLLVVRVRGQVIGCRRQLLTQVRHVRGHGARACTCRILMAYQRNSRVTGLPLLLRPC